jgi:hypothetical protein
MLEDLSRGLAAMKVDPSNIYESDTLLRFPPGLVLSLFDKDKRRNTVWENIMDDFLGSNPVLNVNGISLERLRYTLNLAHDFPAHGYKIDAKNGCLVLMRYPDAPGATPFPSPLGAERCAEIAFDWLATQAYPAEPDHDGSNEKGWLVWTNKWGQIEGHGFHSFVAIKPQWIMFGK